MRITLKDQRYTQANGNHLVKGYAGSLAISRIDLFADPHSQIETEVIRISSRTLPPSPTSKETTPAKPTTSSPTQTPAPGPRYLLNVSYRRSSNKNKSLLRRARSLVEASFGELVDEKGGVEYERVRDWVGEVLGRVVGGAEDGAVGGEAGASSPVGK